MIFDSGISMDLSLSLALTPTIPANAIIDQTGSALLDENGNPILSE